jgi:hypothetical protein
MASNEIKNFKLNCHSDSKVDRIVNRELKESRIVNMRFVAFLATEYDEVLLGYQPGEMVKR